MAKEPRRFAVIPGGVPKDAKERLHSVFCTRCRRERNVDQNAFIEVRTGGFYRRGRMVGFSKVLVCAHCFIKDGHMEIMGHLR